MRCSLSDAVLMAAVVSAALISTSVQAGAWMRSGGEYRYSGGLNYARASHYYDEHSKLQEASCISRDQYLDQSLEYGASYYRTYFGKFTAARKVCGNEKSVETGDLELGVRGRLNLLRNGRTWEASVLIPTNDDSNDPARLGVGAYGLQLGLHGRFAAGGTVLYRHHISVGAEVRVWEGDPSDRLRSYINYNWPSEKFAYKVGARADFSLRNGEGDSSWDQQSRPADDYERVNLAASLKQPLGEWSIEYRASYVVWGWNTDESTTVGISISRSWME